MTSQSHRSNIQRDSCRACWWSGVWCLVSVVGSLEERSLVGGEGDVCYCRMVNRGEWLRVVSDYPEQTAGRTQRRHTTRGN